MDSEYASEVALKCKFTNKELRFRYFPAESFAGKDFCGTLLEAYSEPCQHQTCDGSFSENR